MRNANLFHRKMLCRKKRGCRRKEVPVPWLHRHLCRSCAHRSRRQCVCLVAHDTPAPRHLLPSPSNLPLCFTAPKRTNGRMHNEREKKNEIKTDGKKATNALKCYILSEERNIFLFFCWESIALSQKEYKFRTKHIFPAAKYHVDMKIPELGLAHNHTMIG